MQRTRGRICIFIPSVPTLMMRSAWGCWWWGPRRSWPMGSRSRGTCTRWPVPAATWRQPVTSRRPLGEWKQVLTGSGGDEVWGRPCVGRSWDSVFWLFENQVKFMKRVAEMSDLTQVIRTLPRIKKHLLNPDSMRWVPVISAVGGFSSSWFPLLTEGNQTVSPLQMCSQHNATESVWHGSTAGELHPERRYKQETTQTCQSQSVRGKVSGHTRGDGDDDLFYLLLWINSMLILQHRNHSTRSMDPDRAGNLSV